MNGIEFEFLVADRMRSLGWHAEMTPSSRDLGADIICRIGNETLAVQCKCYDDASYVGATAVGEVLRAKANYKAEQGAIIFRGRASPQALKEAENSRISVLHFDELQIGCDLDRTRLGAELRAQKRLQEAEEKAELRVQELWREAKERKRQEDEYRAALAAFGPMKQQWESAFARHQRWQKVGILLLFVAVIAWVFFPAAGILTLFYAGYAYFLTSPGNEPLCPIAPTWLDATEREECSNVIKSTPGTLEKVVSSAGPWALLNSPDAASSDSTRQWKRTSQGKANVVPHVMTKAYPTEELAEISKGLTRVPCLECGVKLRVPANRRLKISCPRCGTAEVYST